MRIITCAKNISLKDPNDHPNDHPNDQPQFGQKNQKPPKLPKITNQPKPQLKPRNYNTTMASSEQRRLWGEQLAAALPQDCTNLKNYVATGISSDCQILIDQAATNPAQSIALSAFCELLEQSLSYLQRGWDSEKLELAAKQNENDTLQEQLAQKTALNESALTALAAGSGSSGRRLTKDPDSFSGTEKNIAKRQEQYVNWRSQINRCFTVDSHIFNSEFRKIQHIAGLLASEALDLTREHFNTVTEHPKDPELWYWRTTEAVFASLNHQYETVDLSREANLKFDILKMKGRQFQDFIAEFNSLAARCKKTIEQKVDALRLKVSQELSDAITHRDQPSRTDYDGWCKLYQKVYDNLQDQNHYNMLRAGQQTLRTPRNPDRDQNQTRQTLQQPHDDPMQLDMMKPRPTRDECAQKNLCFYCKKPGHRRDQCEEKKRNDARFGNARGNTDPKTNQRPNFQWRHNQTIPHQPGLVQGRPPPWQTTWGVPSGPTFQRARAIEPGFIEAPSISSGDILSTPTIDPQDSVPDPGKD